MFSETLPSRRTILRGAGVGLALPALEALTPLASAAATVAAGPSVDADGVPRRMLLMGTNLGMYAPYFFPEKAGRDFEPSTYLKALEPFRDQYTVCSGLSHPDVGNGHAAEKCILTAAPHPGTSGFKNSISLDQYVAERIGHLTRFPYLALSTTGGSLSYSASGVEIPTEGRPSQVFSALFLDGSKVERERQMRRLNDGRSIMDTVLDQLHDTERQLGARDRQTVDQYLTSVRDLEKRMANGEAWANKPKPKVNAKPPVDVRDRNNIIDKNKLMLDMVHLAFQTDSTRVITYGFYGHFWVPQIEGVTFDWHNLSHRGQNEEKIAQLKLIETEQMGFIKYIMEKLQGTPESGKTLLDRTMIMFTSNLGDASRHDTRNMPVLLAGGGFKHGQHLAWDPNDHPPLCNLYVSMLQRMGVETDRFASGRSTLTGLEAA